MTFTIFHKTGELRDTQGDWDGDDGYDVEIEIAEEKVHRDIAEMLYEDYIKGIEDNEVKNRLFGVILDRIEGLISDLDCWESATKLYYDRLHERYAEE